MQGKMIYFMEGVIWLMISAIFLMAAYTMMVVGSMPH